MGTYKPVKPDPKQIEDAQNLWNGFTTMAKYSACATMVLLVILGLAFVNWS